VNAKQSSIPDVSIVIPIYRERGFLERAIRDLVSGLDRHRINYEILLIEQFSDQQTVDESKALASCYERVHHTLLDKPDFGYAMRTGMLAARGDIIVNFDIDYWDITFVRMCAAMMREFEIDLVIGSKNARLSVDRRSPSRRLISQLFRLVLQSVFGLRVSDTHGIKAWRRTPRLLAQIQACKFTRDIFDTELVIRGERAAFRILELPVTVAELREPRTSIFVRLPDAALRLFSLYLALHRESSKRSTPQGAITEAPIARTTADADP
jgi:glycosyltransferase involved in cell wall biosynthesis